MSFEFRMQVPVHEVPHYIPEIPENEIMISHARSSGPGGQNVNKRSTKAIIKWHVLGSQSFTDAQKVQIERECRNWINNEGCLVIQASATRSQDQNTKDAIARLQEIVRTALTPEKDRIPTKPSRASRARRVDEKTRHGQKKAERGRRYSAED